MHFVDYIIIFAAAVVTQQLGGSKHVHSGVNLSYLLLNAPKMSFYRTYYISITIRSWCPFKKFSAPSVIAL